ncbi:MAG: hypothetical protein AAB788_02180 [Patescibacteria group bacterium]
MFSILAFQMAIVEGFVETNITGRQGVLWINADGQIKDSPQTRQRPIIAGLAEQQFRSGMLLIYYDEGVIEPQELKPTAVGLTTQAFAKLSQLYSR